MQFAVYSFNELSVKQLHSIYYLRTKVFVVEQNCAYQDADEKDLKAFHLLMNHQDTLIGYCRILPPGVSYPECAIGRVVIDPAYRKKKLGIELMKRSIQQAVELFDCQIIVISAQTYLLNFYGNLGFVPQGETYLEDDISHIKMRLTLSH